MDALSFLKEYGTAEAEAVCGRAGTSIAYFRQIAYRHRRPSSAMAKKLADASSHRLDVMSLLFPPDAPAPGPQQQAAQAPPNRQMGG